MSVVVRDPFDKIVIMTKGADNVMFERYLPMSPPCLDPEQFMRL